MNQTTPFKKTYSVLGAVCAVLLFSFGTVAAQSLGERLAGEQAVDADRVLVQFLNDKFRSGQSAVYVVVTRNSAPDPRLWDRWKAAGVSFSVNLKNDAWIMRVAASQSESANSDMVRFLRGSVGAVKAFPYIAAYKARGDLLAGRFRFTNQRKDTDDNIVVEFLPETPPSIVERAIVEFHRGPSPSERIAELTWALRIDPDRIRALADLNHVYVVDEKIPRLPLMNEMRSITGVDDVQAMVLPGLLPPTYALSGLGIRMSNGEGLSLVHPDFKQDTADVVPRWAGCAFDSAHGAMTAGLMLGDGSGSVAGGAATVYQWRGVAPNATYVCDNSTPGSGQPDVANFSFVEAYGDYTSDVRNADKEVRGGNGPILRIPHVRAAGNNGVTPPQYDTETGYYSMLGTSKNSIVVGNVDALDLRWQGTGSSLGPTFDNRIKPDVVAPGTIVSYVGDANGIMVDIEFVRVMQGATTVVDWSFSPSNGFYGWGQNLNGDLWWTNANLPSLTLASAACGPVSTNCLRAQMSAPPWDGYRHRPYLATFARPNPIQPEDLNIVPAANDVVEIKYRILPSQERDIGLTLFFGKQNIVNIYIDDNYYTISNHGFPVIADGNWNVVSIPVGSDPNWVAKLPSINYVGLAYDGPSALHIPIPGTGYGAAGGTSAAAPVVAGIVALMLERMTKPPLNVVVPDHTNWSPYYRAQPATGAPLPSTLKAILIHTARDLAYMPHLSDVPNSDTNAPLTYHRGPDLVTGYGLVDAKAAIDIITLDETAAPIQKNIYEDQFTTGDILPANATPPCTNGCPLGYREYVRLIPAGRTLPLKVTLAYDDFEGSSNPDPAVQVSPRLVNAIDLELIGPSGTVFRPWTIDPPYVASSLPAGYPGNIEPEPISASDIHPARRDQINDRDNVKQVVVDYPEAGTWRIVVGMHSFGAPPPQTFSLVIDGAVARPAPNLSGGKIVYTSPLPGLFGSTLQMFVKSIGSTSETQITNGGTNVRDPSWSYNANYIGHITDAGWSCNWSSWPWFSWKPESIDIRTPTGTLVASFPTFSTTGRQHAKYTDWSPSGRHIVVTSFDAWGTRELRLITFSAPYIFSSPTTSVLVPTNFAGNSDDPTDGQFSPDGKYVYFHADSNVDTGQIYKVNVSSGVIEKIFGDGAPMRRAYHVSISHDGSTLLFNSELYKDSVPNHIDEELLSVGLQTGIITQLTKLPGKQHGRFAKNGVGKEVLLQSNPTPNGPYDLFLFENGTITPTLTTVHKVEGGADWVK